MTIKTTNKFSIISIVNWNTYQIERQTSNQQNDQQVTSKRPATDHKQELKEDKEDNTVPGKPDGAPGNKLQKHHIPFDEIVSYLNKKTGKHYRSDSKNTQSLIRVRFNQGFSLVDFIAVIDKKTAKWSTDSKMMDYLRPETLFGTKFESYLNESIEPVAAAVPRREYINSESGADLYADSREG